MKNTIRILTLLSAMSLLVACGSHNNNGGNNTDDGNGNGGIDDKYIGEWEEDSVDDLQFDSNGNPILNNVKLTMWSTVTNPDSEYQDKIIKEFNKAYEGQIELVYSGGGVCYHETRFSIYGNFAKTVNQDPENAPDLFYGYGERIAAITNQDLIVPIGPYLHNRDNQTKRNYPLKEFIDENGHIELYIDAGANSRYWEGHRGDEGRFGFCDLCLKNYEYEDIYFDIQVLQDLAETIDPSAPIYKPLVDGIVKIRDLYWYECEERYTKAKAIVNQLFLLPKIKGPTNDEVILEAHSHLDMSVLLL